MPSLYDRQGNEFVQNWKTGARGQPVHRRSQPCNRCGGLGGSEKWRPTGWTCFRCGGNGIDPNPEYIKLYTAEQNAKLDVTLAKRHAAAQAKREEKARLEQERRDRERTEMLTIYATWIKRIEAELAFGEIEILRSVLERVTVLSLDPTERQIEVVEEIISKNEKERARLETAGYIGEIGERREFNLTLVFARSEQTGEFPTIWSHWSVYHDETGSTVVSSSDPHIMGIFFDRDEGYKRGQTTRVKATVKSHYMNKKGEPCTKISRPKKLPSSGTPS